MLSNDINTIHKYIHSLGFTIQPGRKWEYDSTTKTIHVVKRAIASPNYICSLLHELGHGLNTPNPMWQSLKYSRITKNTILALILDDEKAAWDTGWKVLHDLQLHKYNTVYIDTYTKHYTSYVKALPTLPVWRLRMVAFPYIYAISQVGG